MEHLAAAVRVAAQDEARPEPPQQLRTGDSSRRLVLAQSPADLIKLDPKSLLRRTALIDFFP